MENLLLKIQAVFAQHFNIYLSSYASMLEHFNRLIQYVQTEMHYIWSAGCTTLPKLNKLFNLIISDLDVVTECTPADEVC